MYYNSISQIYKDFCEYIAKTFFTPERRGESVSMIVNKKFISNACESLGVTETKLIKECQKQFEYAYRIYYEGGKLTLGIICIQLYAASKRANDYVATSRNYRIQLARLFDMCEEDISSLFNDYQDKIWSSFYKWCKDEGFKVYECKPFWGAGRYVQYPIKMSERTLTEEDLRYFASDFVTFNLYPHEDISFQEFKRILPNLYRLHLNSSHARSIIYSYKEEAYEQIYNFYRLWDGSYINYGKEEKAKESDLILLNEENWELIVYDSSSMKRKRSLQLKEANNYGFINQLPFKHDSLLLFHKHEDYEGYWEEKRYLDKEEEGIAVVFKQTYLYYQFKDIIQEFPTCKVVRIKYSINNRNFFADDEIPYRLEGGLKIGMKSIYLINGTPLLFVKGKRRFWIDDKPYDNKTDDWCQWTFTSASVGEHIIKIPGHKQLSFNIIDEPYISHAYPPDALKWKLDKKYKSWEQIIENDNVIVGLDFSSIPMKDNYTNKSILNRWSNAIAYNKKKVGEKNLVINLITN